jgi:hypothetical protein
MDETTKLTIFSGSPPPKKTTFPFSLTYYNYFFSKVQCDEKKDGYYEFYMYRFFE